MFHHVLRKKEENQEIRRKESRVRIRVDSAGVFCDAFCACCGLLEILHRQKGSSGAFSPAMKMKPDPCWVCQDCGMRASAGRAFSVSTYHSGTCDICGKETAVTEPRDFYYPRFPNCAEDVSEHDANNRKQRAMIKRYRMRRKAPRLGKSTAKTVRG